MRESRLGRYVYLTLAILIILGGWMILTAAQRQLQRLGTGKQSAKPAANLSAPRATGPLAGDAAASSTGGPSGPSGAPGDEQPSTSTESDGRKTLPPGAIW